MLLRSCTELSLTRWHFKVEKIHELCFWVPLGRPLTGPTFPEGPLHARHSQGLKVKHEPICVECTDLSALPAPGQGEPCVLPEASQPLRVATYLFPGKTNISAFTLRTRRPRLGGLGGGHTATRHRPGLDPPEADSTGRVVPRFPAGPPQLPRGRSELPEPQAGWGDWVPERDI